jgi:RNA polymerase sigma-70 factor (ECF subfamily)
LSGWRVNVIMTRPEPMPDDDAIVRMYRETVRPLYRYVSRRVGGDRSLAEDLVQDAWMRALDAWPAGGIPNEPLAWLIRVAHNSLVSHFRRTVPGSVDAAAIDLEAPAFRPEAADTGQAVSWGLARLRRRHADLLESFYFDGKSVQDIAREHSLSERAVEGRLRRARLKLKSTLQRKLYPAASKRAGSAAGGTHHA